MTATAVASDYVLGPNPARWEELERPLTLDPATFEILRHKLESINEEQAIALKDVSVSPIVTAASDFNNALYTADGRIASMGRQVVFHSGAMPVVLRHVMEAFTGEESPRATCSWSTTLSTAPSTTPTSHSSRRSFTVRN